MLRMLVVLGRNHLVVVLHLIVIWHERLFITVCQIVYAFHTLINLWRDHYTRLQLILFSIFIVRRTVFNIVTAIINILILESQGTIWIIRVRKAFLKLGASWTLLLDWSIARTFDTRQLFGTIRYFSRALRILLIWKLLLAVYEVCSFTLG